jgi:hypothetical protein
MKNETIINQQSENLNAVDLEEIYFLNLRAQKIIK